MCSGLFTIFATRKSFDRCSRCTWRQRISAFLMISITQWPYNQMHSRSPSHRRINSNNKAIFHNHTRIHDDCTTHLSHFDSIKLSQWTGSFWAPVTVSDFMIRELNVSNETWKWKHFEISNGITNERISPVKHEHEMTSRWRMMKYEDKESTFTEEHYFSLAVYPVPFQS